MAIVRGFTPDQRGPSLGDGTGGTSERPEARTASPTIRNLTYAEKDIRLTPTGTGIVAGTCDTYDFGLVTKDAVGRYVAQYQDAASPTADGLGASIRCEFAVYEASAGVFVAKADIGVVGGAAEADDATLDAVVDATLDAETQASKAIYFVATAADVVDAAAMTAALTLTEGHLYLLDAHAASTRVHSLERRF